MADFITLSCPSCGAKLEVTPDIDRFACAHCGQEHIVKRSGGIVSLSPVVDAIKNVQTGVDKTAAELGIVRIQKEIDGLRIDKNNLIKEQPKPYLSIFTIFFMGTGATFLLLSLVLFLNQGADVAGYTLIFGLVVIGFSSIPLFTLTEKKESWERDTGKKIKSIEVIIAAKQSELNNLQNIVKL